MNTIKRKTKTIEAIALIDFDTIKQGTFIRVFKNDFGYLMLNKTTGIYSYIFISYLRNENLFKIINQFDKNGEKIA